MWLAVVWAGLRAGQRTEQSCRRVWMQPEPSFCTQQPDSRSCSCSCRTSCSIFRSFLMQGENLAPKWMRSIYGAWWEAFSGPESAAWGTSFPHSPWPRDFVLTELGPIQKFSCWMYFTLSYTPLFLSTWGRDMGVRFPFLI